MDKHSGHMEPQGMAELIRRYFAGELDDAAMHALEKQALSDPFLAEALEGFEAHLPDQHAQLSALEARLKQRVQAAQVPPVAASHPPASGNVPVPNDDQPATSVIPMRRFDYRWAVAAAVLVLVAVGGYQWLHRDTPGQAPIAQNSLSPRATATPAYDHPDPAITATVADTAAPGLAAAKPDPTHNPPHVTASATSTNELADVAASPSLRAPAALAPAIMAKEKNWADSAPAAPAVALGRLAATGIDDRKQSSPSAEPSVMPPATRAAMPRQRAMVVAGAAATQSAGAKATDSLIVGFDKNTANDLAVKGRVLDDKGAPLPGVVVRFKGAPTAVQTNMDGYFSLPANGGDARKVELQYVGFDKVDTLLYASNNTSNIILQPAAANLNEEVVVAGYAAGRNGAYQPPKPANGYDSLHRYLDNALQVDGNPRKKMRIIFTVTPTGKLENFHILNGVSDFVDQQVIELLKEGPAWRPASDARPTQVKLAVKVPAPKK